jgi:hypothetical protein
MIRRSLGDEHSAEDRLLARRWVIAIPSFYSTIIVIMTIAAVLANSTASFSAKSERKDLLHDRSGPRLLYGSLPNMVDVDLACTASRPCMGLRANGVGSAKMSDGPDVVLRNHHARL